MEFNDPDHPRVGQKGRIAIGPRSRTHALIDVLIIDHRVYFGYDEFKVEPISEYTKLVYNKTEWVRKVEFLEPLPEDNEGDTVYQING